MPDLGWSLTAQDVFNNVSRTAIESDGGDARAPQSLHTNALDEALALPTDFSARIARNTHSFCSRIGTTRVIDPWADRSYVERAHLRARKVGWGHIVEVEQMGGMAKAIEAGLPKLRIEEAAAKTQARNRPPDPSRHGQQVSPENEAAINVLQGRHSAVRALQLRQASRASGATRRARRHRGARRPHPVRPGGNGTFPALASDARARQRRRWAKFAGAGKRSLAATSPRSRRSRVSTKREAGTMSESSYRVLKQVANSKRTKAGGHGSLVAKIGQDGHDRGQKGSHRLRGSRSTSTSAAVRDPRRSRPPGDRERLHIVGVSSLAPAI